MAQMESGDPGSVEMSDTAMYGQESDQATSNSEPEPQETFEVSAGGENSEADVSHDDEKGKIKFSSTLQRDEAVRYFEAIVDGIKKGRLQFKRGEHTLSLSPKADEITIELKASRKKDKQKLEFEVGWRVPKEAELEVG